MKFHIKKCDFSNKKLKNKLRFFIINNLILQSNFIRLNLNFLWFLVYINQSNHIDLILKIKIIILFDILFNILLPANFGVSNKLLNSIIYIFIVIKYNSIAKMIIKTDWAFIFMYKSVIPINIIPFYF